MTGTREEVRMGPQGRIVIPAALRKALDLATGDRLIVRRDGDSIVIERREALIQRMQARFAHLPPEVDLAAELLRERREEAKRENEA